MSDAKVEQMVKLVQDGYTPESVLETIVWELGSWVKVNKATKGHDPVTKAEFSIPEGAVVSILGIGGGSSGADPHVKMKDGKEAIIPFRDLGEGLELLKREEDLTEMLTDVVAKVILAKPLPQSVVDWVGGGYMDYGVELPSVPSNDSEKGLEFFMKAGDQETLDSAIETLKRVSGASFKSSSPAKLTDWLG